MIFEEFDPKITPEQTMFDDRHESHASQNAVTEKNLQFDILMVRLSTILPMLIEDLEANQPQEQGKNKNQLSIALSRSFRRIKNNHPGIELKGRLFKSMNDNDLAKLEDIGKERRQVQNILSRMINKRNIEFNTIKDSELQEIDQGLSWLVQEYNRLSRLPILTDCDTKRMLLILELAQVDSELDDFINKIDIEIAEEVGLIETNLSTDISSDNSYNKSSKEDFVKNLEQNLSSSEDGK